MEPGHEAQFACRPDKVTRSPRKYFRAVDPDAVTFRSLAENGSRGSINDGR